MLKYRNKYFPNFHLETLIDSTTMHDKKNYKKTNTGKSAAQMFFEVKC